MSAPTAELERISEHRLGLEEILGALLADGLIEQSAVQKMQRWRSEKDLHPLVVIANQKLTSCQPPQTLLNLETLTEWLAQHVGLPYRHIDPLEVDMVKTGSVISYAYAYRYRILPLEVSSTRITFATAEPYLQEWIDDLRKLLRKDIQRVIANPLDINRYLMEFYGLTRSVIGAQSQGGQSDRGILNFEQLWELGKTSELGAEDKPVIQIVDWLLQYAFEQRASDIHLEPRRERGFVRFRIDGVLHKVYELPPSVMTAVTSRIKILGRMDVADKRRPQDGRVKTRTPGGREVELRLSTMPTAFGEKCVMRIFDPDIAVKNFSLLGFTPRESELWQQMIDRPNGIILVTGPTGSGKTTTLYSTLKHLARPEVNVCTVEDPIEDDCAGIQSDAGAADARSHLRPGHPPLLRQDPDIIMVGEIRDLETAQMAVQAALTGHLVFSTLHTNDAPSAITRLLDLGIPYYLIQGLPGDVLAQRLVHALCPNYQTHGTINSAL
ncbi:MAG: GspE/PulE family protein [Gammaproteobacteria bacterium]